MCDVTHSYVRLDDVTQSYVSHVLFVCTASQRIAGASATHDLSLIHMCDVTHVRVM